MSAQKYRDEDDEIEYVPIPMDRATRERLVKLSAVVSEHPVHVASELLAALLRDDEAAHRPLN